MSVPGPGGSPRGARKPAGRPKWYNPWDCLELWLYVQEQMRRTKSSVNQVCNVGHFAWFTLGRGGTRRTKTITKATLRRVYQEICRFLKAEQTEYEKFRNSLTPESRERSFPDTLCPTLRWYHDELERRLAY